MFGRRKPGVVTSASLGLCLLIGVSAALASPKPRTAKDALPLLQTVREVRQLTPEQAARGYPVRVKGVITCYEKRTRPRVCLFKTPQAESTLTSSRATAR